MCCSLCPLSAIDCYVLFTACFLALDDDVDCLLMGVVFYCVLLVVCCLLLVIA